MNKKKLIFSIIIILFFSVLQINSEIKKRAMTFPDVIRIRSVGSPDISVNGEMFIYTITTPNWEKNKKFSDIYITSITNGEMRQMTFTEDKSEHSPKWFKDCSFFAFLSNRSEDKTQIFFMRPYGGEGWQVTNDKYGVSSYRWSKNFEHIAYLGGKQEEKQIWLMSGKGENTEKLTEHKTPVSSFTWSPDSKKIYFTAADSVDSIDKKRKEI